jgi:ketosteroid isomerase-like protein
MTETFDDAAEDAATAAAVRDAFERYNAALDAGDVAALNGFFRDSPQTVRFGPGENLFGFAEIAAFRSGRWQPGAGARVFERVVVSPFGRDFATTNALIRGADGTLSRQSQTWVRGPAGWQIVAAHVSRSPV